MKNILIILFLVTLIFIGCGKSENPSKSAGNKTVPVTVATVIQKDVPVNIENIGTVEAYSVVSVLSQVNGLLTQVHIKEGQEVKKGTILFTIDKESFETSLRQAEANLAKYNAQRNQAEAILAKDSAELRNTQVELKRYDGLFQRGVVTRQEYDNLQTKLETLEATIQADIAGIRTAQESIRAGQADVENARIQLAYCTIRSPIDGHTGGLFVNQGNVIRANDRPLITINRINPIYISFTVPEQELPRIQKYMIQNKLNVIVTIPGSQETISGELTFVDNIVDRQSGTIRLKGLLQNKELKLWPGQFVNVRLILTVEPNKLVIPSNALMDSQEGQYVYIVKEDKSVESKPVQVSRIMEDEAVIDNGLQLGETIVTEGQMRLVPGAKVEIKTNPDSSQKVE